MPCKWLLDDGSPCLNPLPYPGAAGHGDLCNEHVETELAFQMASQAKETSLVKALDQATLAIRDEQLRARFSEYLLANRAPNTFKAYAEDWKLFEKWLNERSKRPADLVPGDVAAFLTELELQKVEKGPRAGEPRRASSIRRAWYGVKYVLKSIHPWAREKTPPEPIELTLNAIARIRKEAPQKKRAISTSELARIVEPCGADLRGTRDRAILLLGWYGMFRRSELSKLEVRDLTFDPDGLRVKIRSSKKDQTGKGFEKAIHFSESARYCAVGSVRAWLYVAGIEKGLVFRAIPARGSVVGDRGLSGIAIWSIVKEHCKIAGLDEKLYGAHSMRAGGITAAALAGKSIPVIQGVSGHTSADQLLGYVRPARLFDNDATKGIGPK